MKIRLSRIALQAHSRPPGYAQKVLAAGTIEGEFLRLTPRAYNALYREFNGDGFVRPKPLKRGLGDIVEKLVKPIAKLSDKILGTSFVNCRPCQKRKEKLNKLGDKIMGKV